MSFFRLLLLIIKLLLCHNAVKLTIVIEIILPNRGSCETVKFVVK